MRDRHSRSQRPDVTERAGRETSTADRTSQQLVRLAGAVGNDEVARQLKMGNASRDAMLEHLCGRLRVMRELQLRELGQTERGAHYEWWREVADSHRPEFGKPEPTRWADPARLYEDASYHLCRGDLGRGRTLMLEAIDAEQRVMDALSVVVPTEDADRDAARDAVGDWSEHHTCGEREEPEDVQLARDIQAVTTEMDDLPNRRRTRDPWWALEEDEEEEEAPDDGGQ